MEERHFAVLPRPLMMRRLLRVPFPLAPRSEVVLVLRRCGVRAALAVRCGLRGSMAPGRHRVPGPGIWMIDQGEGAMVSKSNLAGGGTTWPRTSS